jgi:hypothetical protein
MLDAFKTRAEAFKLMDKMDEHEQDLERVKQLEAIGMR